jgi:hypothetical protein
MDFCSERVQEEQETMSADLPEDVRAVLLAVAAEDWNDETKPLLEGKPQGIGPCARVRRLLGLAYEDAVIKRAASLPPEFRSKRAPKTSAGNGE